MSGTSHRRSGTDEEGLERRSTRPHRRVGNTSPGAISGRSADLDGRRFRQRSEDQVRWDPVDEVHYVSTSSALDGGRESRDRQRRQSDTGARQGRVAAWEPEDEYYEDEGYDDGRDAVSHERPSFRDRLLHALEALGSVPGRIASWVVRHRRFSITVACVIAAVLFVFGPVQRYYVAWRTSSDLQAEADYLDADNDALKSDLDRLQSKEGIEDEARRRGYTYQNEESENADGVSDNANQGSDATDGGFSAADIERPWYIQVLDFIFVYKGVS